MGHKDEDSELTVIARAPFHIYYEGPADTVTATNKVGQFDILPGHASFFSVLSPGEVTIDAKGQSVDFHISNGIIAVSDNEVMLFVNM